MSQPRKISVIGFGLMGAQISQVFALSEYDVVAYDTDADRLKLGIDLIRSGKYGLENSVNKNRISKEAADRALDRIVTTNSFEGALLDSEFVLEAAIEDLVTKQMIFRKASEIARDDVVLATNTSTISITKIGAALDSTARNRLSGMHFFNPPQVMKLIEIVKTPDTGKDVVSIIQEVSKKLGKTSILVEDYPGFVANRMGILVFAEASAILARGIASIRDIDIGMRLGYGYPVGPFELGDLVGLDSRLRNMKALYEETGDEKFKPPDLLIELVSKGFIGDRKTKSGSKGGYYEYFGIKRPSEE